MSIKVMHRIVTNIAVGGIGYICNAINRGLESLCRNWLASSSAE